MQEFIELARERRLQEAIAYAKKHLTPWQESHLTEINRVMALLLFLPDTKVPPYKVLDTAHCSPYVHHICLDASYAYSRLSPTYLSCYSGYMTKRAGTT